MQDDLLYENLTVRETLYYAAMLKLPRSMSVKEKTRRVDLTIKALGIGDCQHTIVGKPCGASSAQATSIGDARWLAQWAGAQDRSGPAHFLACGTLSLSLARFLFRV